LLAGEKLFLLSSPFGDLAQIVRCRGVLWIELQNYFELLDGVIQTVLPKQHDPKIDPACGMTRIQADCLGILAQ
jgi:hypothetical protein